MHSSCQMVVRRSAVASAGLRPRPSLTTTGTRAFSSAPAPNTPETSASTATAAPPVFQYAKSQALFERITETMTEKEDIRALQQEISKILGRTWRQNEFYYTGFGNGRKGKGKGGGDAAAEVEAAPVQTVFDLKLTGFDAKSKIKVIKEVRSIAGLGLKEAKEMVEGFPKVIMKGMEQEQAEELKAKLEAIGATIELV
jgi:large subunit ribosomal protein L7/L12